MLGTNDFQSMHQHNASHSAQGIASLVRAIRRAPIEPDMPVPPILIVAPPPAETPAGHDGGEVRRRAREIRRCSSAAYRGDRCGAELCVLRCRARHQRQQRRRRASRRRSARDTRPRSSSIRSGSSYEVRRARDRSPEAAHVARERSRRLRRDVRRSAGHAVSDAGQAVHARRRVAQHRVLHGALADARVRPLGRRGESERPDDRPHRVSESGRMAGVRRSAGRSRGTRGARATRPKAGEGRCNTRSRSSISATSSA